MPESIFGATTQDYVLRSVGAAVVLLIGVGIAGMTWVYLDRLFVPLVRADASTTTAPRDMRVVWLMRVLSFSWIMLPALVAVAAETWESSFWYVFLPVSIAIGVLLLVYGSHLRQLDKTADVAGRRQNVVLWSSGVLLVCISLFSAAARYAEVEGNALASSMEITALARVVVHSQSRLHLEGPGVVETKLSEVRGDFRYQYGGLRLLAYSDGKYILLSDGWTSTDGVAFVLPGNTETIRFDFVRGSP